jgi:quercetin dioxygenase-like cupin family protein
MNKSTLIKESIKTNNARVAEYSIPSNSRGRKHIHNNVFEELYCLSGVLRVELSGQADAELNGGDKVFIPQGTKHCITNVSDKDARFLVVQGGGDFDLVADEV